MSLTYVLVSLFRGDDIEQTEYVLGQLQRLSAEPRPILLFNGGLEPRGTTALAQAYKNVRLLELPVPEDWQITEEFHYFDYVATQLYKYVETDYYLKMDRDICVLLEGFDNLIVEYLRSKPDLSAAGSLMHCARNLSLDGSGLFDWLPAPMSFAKDRVLNGGVEVFQTAALREVGPLVEEHGRRIWQKSRELGEDDLISFTLQGTGHQIEDCPLLKSYGRIDPASIVARRPYDERALRSISSAYGGACIIHGLKPFSIYRPFYAEIHSHLHPGMPIRARHQPNRKDAWCFESQRSAETKPEAAARYDYIEPLLYESYHGEGGTPLQKSLTTVSDIYAHLALMYYDIVQKQRKRIVELGTGPGNSLEVLAFAAREVGGHVTSIDNRDCLGARQRIETAALQPFCQMITADDMSVAWNTAIDFLLIDSEHTYEQASRELSKYEPLVEPGGVIAMHDTTSHPDVWQAAQTYFQGRADVTLRRFYHNNGLAWVEKHNGDGHRSSPDVPPSDPRTPAGGQARHL